MIIFIKNKVTSFSSVSYVTEYLRESIYFSCTSGELEALTLLPYSTQGSPPPKDPAPLKKTSLFCVPQLHDGFQVMKSTV